MMFCDLDEAQSSDDINLHRIIHSKRAEADLATESRILFAPLGMYQILNKENTPIRKENLLNTPDNAAL